MSKSQIKIMMKISDPTIDNYIELTSSILEYNGKRKLEKYPFFDPSITLTSNLRKMIQNLTYDKKLEVFFHQDTFNNIFVKSSKKNNNSNNLFQIFLATLPNTLSSKINSILTKPQINELHRSIKNFGIKSIMILSEDVEPIKKLKEGLNAHQTDMYNNYILSKNRNENAGENFEFMIQTILSTGFPVANYYQTMEFYDSKYTNRKITLKGSKSSFDWLLPSRFERTFSYIKQNNKIYTVTGVTWANDILSVPVYKRVLDSYKEYWDEKKGIDEQTRENNQYEIDLKIMKLIIEIKHDEKLWKDDTHRYPMRTRDKNEDETLIFRNKMISFFEDVRGKNGKNNFLNMNTKNKGNKPNLQDTFKFKEVEHLLKNQTESNVIKAKHHLLDTKDKIPSENSSIFSFGNNTPSTKSIIDTFITDTKDLRANLKEIFKNANKSAIMNMDSQISPYKNKLVIYYNEIKKLLLNADIYDIVLNNTPYRDREPEYVKEIEAELENKFKKYKDFTNSLKELSKGRKFSNLKWENEFKKITGKEEKSLTSSNSEGDTNDENLFDYLNKCKENNRSCVRNVFSNKIDRLLLNVEEIQGPGTNKLYEAYVLLDVLEGKLTNDNYKGLACKYMQDVLGDYVQKDEIDEDDNDYTKDNTFIPFSKTIESYNKSINSKKQNKPTNKTKKKRSTQTKTK